ncbi:unnamed protein product [Ectocarpus sp. 12 AP-2014]
MRLISFGSNLAEIFYGGDTSEIGVGRTEHSRCGVCLPSGRSASRARRGPTSSYGFKDYAKFRRGRVEKKDIRGCCTKGVLRLVVLTNVRVVPPPSRVAF